MCGRYLFRDDYDASIDEFLETLSPSDKQDLSLKEVFPSQKTIVINQNNDFQVMRWGYEKEDIKNLVINARSETAKDSPFFADDLKLRRCIIQAKGFFEWNSDKEKNFVKPTQDDYFYMAAVYSDEENPHFAIITTASQDDFAALHHRIPLMIPKPYIKTYLSEGYQHFEDFKALKQLPLEWVNQSIQTRLF